MKHISWLIFLIAIGALSQNPGPALTGAIASGSAPPPVTAQIRGSGIYSGSFQSYAMPFPSGTITGDFAVIFAGHAYSVGSGPSGWSVADSTGATPYFTGAVFYKTLNSGDISTGSATVTANGYYDGVISIITFVGATGGIRETVGLRSDPGASPVVQTATSADISSTDTAIYFGSNRAASTDTVSLGSLLQTTNDGNAASGCLYAQTGLTAGVPVQPTFYYSAPGDGYYQVTLIVKVS